MDWDLIIFDCDGVLVNSEPIGNRLIAEALTYAGLPMSSDGALYEFLGGKLTLIKVGAEEKLGRKLPDDVRANSSQTQHAVGGVVGLTGRCSECVKGWSR